MTPLLRRFALACAFVSVAAMPAKAQQKLFKGDTVLNLTISTDLRALIRQRDSLQLAKHMGVMSYKDSAGTTVKLPVQVRARGHFRRQSRNCDFPPLWVNWKSADAKKTMFKELARAKITTNCRPGNSEYEQYILQEYALYKMYEQVHADGFRTRLARITYEDSANKMKPITSWAFFIEDHSDLAQRLKLSPFEQAGALFDDVDPEALATVSLFQFFAGNTDWSISGLHNIAMVRDSVSGKITTIAYDFDWSGAVDARYANPDSRLKIRRTTDRLFRGPCYTVEQLKPALETFVKNREAIDGVLAKVPALSPDLQKRMLKWNAEFWKLAVDPKAAQKEFSYGCQKAGN